MPEFTGFPVEALDFYDDLEMDNTKSFWATHRSIYDTAVLGPMTSLMRGLEPTFGPAKVFRPYRDVRFAKDKTPYKDHQGAFVAAGPSTGWYVEVGAPGVRVGAGFYDAASDRLASLRSAIGAEKAGSDLVRILGGLKDEGWTLSGETLKTSPRGYAADHPRIDLLRHKSMAVTRSYGFDELIHTPRLLDRVRVDWEAATPFVNWLSTHGG
ncbi:MAG: DUF2461 domain-containing protein [Nocardioides sp.]